MTNAEQNKAVNKLAKDYSNLDKKYSDDEYWVQREKLINEYKRLYNADNTLSKLNADNVRRMIGLNLVMRAIPFHMFGIHIELV